LGSARVERGERAGELQDAGVTGVDDEQTAIRSDRDPAGFIEEAE
jgi:hypothetical protein